MLKKEYIIGLVDGEGSFTAFVRNPDKIDNTIIRRVKVEPRFYVKLIEKDRIMLDDLKKYFKCGNVYFQKDSRKNHQNCYRFEVANRKNLAEIIIPFFQKNKLKFPSKKNDFRVFCEIMRKIKKNEHLNQSGLREIYQLKQKMH